MEASRYQVTQDGKDYILSTVIINDKIRIECQDNNFTPIPTYYKDYSLTDLNSFSEIFKLIPTIVEAQNELNNAIEQQQVKLTNKNDFMEISFTVQISNYVQEIIFQLPMRSTSPVSPVSNISAPTITAVEDEDYPDCTYSTQPNAPVQVVSQQVMQRTEQTYEYPLDHDRINKIESNSNLIKENHEHFNSFN